MLKKIARLKLSVIMIILFITCTATTAKETTFYIMEEQYRKPLTILDELYKVFLNESLDQARKTVKMLDEVYKTFIILITAEYVDNPSVLPAATLSKKVFKEMDKKGWHNVRLLDATGTPFNPENNPRDDFERDAIKAIISGETYFEKVEKIKGREYLRAATSVPAVMKGCITCHPDKKVGDLIGAISYKIPLKD